MRWTIVIILVALFAVVLVVGLVNMQHNWVLIFFQVLRLLISYLTIKK